MKTIAISTRAVYNCKEEDDEVMRKGIKRSGSKKKCIKCGSNGHDHYTTTTILSNSCIIYILIFLLNYSMIITLCLAEQPHSSSNSVKSTTGPSGLTEELKYDLKNKKKEEKDQLEIRSMIKGRNEKEEDDDDGNNHKDGKVEGDELKDYAKEVVSDEKNDEGMMKKKKMKINDEDGDVVNEEVEDEKESSYSPFILMDHVGRDAAQNGIVFVDENSQFAPNYRRKAKERLQQRIGKFAQLEKVLIEAEKLGAEITKNPISSAEELEHFFKRMNELMAAEREADYMDFVDENEDVTEGSEEEVDKSVDNDTQDYNDKDEEEDYDDDTKSAAVIHRHFLTSNDTDELVELNPKEKKVLRQSEL